MFEGTGEVRGMYRQPAGVEADPPPVLLGTHVDSLVPAGVAACVPLRRPAVQGEPLVQGENSHADHMSEVDEIFRYHRHQHLGETLRFSSLPRPSTGYLCVPEGSYSQYDVRGGAEEDGGKHRRALQVDPPH